MKYLLIFVLIVGLGCKKENQYCFHCTNYFVKDNITIASIDTFMCNATYISGHTIQVIDTSEAAIVAYSHNYSGTTLTQDSSGNYHSFYKGKEFDYTKASCH